LVYGALRGPVPTEMEILEANETEERRLQAELDRLAVEIRRAELAVVEAATAAHAQALADGDALIRRELPGLVQAQRTLQKQWQAFAVKLEACDHRTGGLQRFVPAAWSAMLPDSIWDGWAQRAAAQYQIDLP
jgi:hypothetical protein